MRVLLIFIDGIGLGANDPDVNPFARYGMPLFQELFGGPLTRSVGKVIHSRGCLVPIDAGLGVAGLPQSASGQTTLFTGINAARTMGMHVHAFPGPRLTEIITKCGIMKRLLARGFRVASANMYTPDYMDLVAARKRRHSATTLVTLTAGQPLRSVKDMLEGKAVYQDITNEMLLLSGFKDIPVIAPEVAGHRLVEIAQEHHFTLFEYFQTDRCGHKQNWKQAEEIIDTLQRFLMAIYYSQPEDMLVMITSDHGNFEDLGTKKHTLNQVPAILFGKRCTEIAESIDSLTDVTPAVLAALDRG